MADVSDVENVLVNTVSGIVYPNGIGQPSVIDRDIRVYRGHSLAKSLDADLAAGVVNISVEAIKGMYRPVTQFMRQWRQLPAPTPTLTTTVDNITLTIGGTVDPTVPQTIMIIANHISYPYVVQQSDTLDSIATAIADLIPSASAAGPVVTIPSYDLIARIGVQGTSLLKVKRQDQVFDIKVRVGADSGGYAIRDQLCSIIDAQIALLIRISLPDGLFANIFCKNGLADDYGQKAKLLWRSMFYNVEYDTTITKPNYTITSITDDLSIVKEITN